jgi:hypothetical protein
MVFRHILGVVLCVECGQAATGPATAWRAYRINEPGRGEEPQLAFYCPWCAVEEFGAPPPPQLREKEPPPPF